MNAIRTIPHQPLSDTWVKAAVLGSIWASVEIVLGSFLHNLRLPFAGSMLACISVWLLVAFARQWYVKGLIIRAGIIAALLKSISPSAVILGPMMGIFIESLILEMGIRLLGRNLPGLLVAGGLALLGTLLQKFGKMLLIYGTDLIRLADALLEAALPQIDPETTGLLYALLIFVGIYFSAGAVAAAAGYLTGRRPTGGIEPFLGAASEDRPGKNQGSSDSARMRGKSHALFQHDMGQSYSGVLLLLHIFAMIGVLYLINTQGLMLATPLAALYVTFCLIRYRRSTGRMKKWSFWLPFVLITITAALVLEGVGQDHWFSRDGLLIGLRMNVRAFTFLTAFHAISTEMKNPTVKLILYRRGFSRIYQASHMAFSSLPFLLGFFAEKKGRKGLRSFTFARLLQAASQLYHTFRKYNETKPTVFVITGQIGQGKTTYAREVAELLKAAGISMGGFLAEGNHEKGRRMGFRLQALHSEDSIKLCSIDPKPGWTQMGKYYFDPQAIEKGNEWLDLQDKHGVRVMMVDEVGHLELKGQGWARGIEAMLQRTDILQLWVVRDGLAEKVARKWNVGDVHLCDISRVQPADAAAAIRRLLPRDTDSGT